MPSWDHVTICRQKWSQQEGIYFHQFFHGPKPSRESNECIWLLRHKALSRMHIPNYRCFAVRWVFRWSFISKECFRYNSMDIPSKFHKTSCNRPHHAGAPAPIDYYWLVKTKADRNRTEGPVMFVKELGQRARWFYKSRVVPFARSTENTNAYRGWRVHWRWRVKSAIPGTWWQFYLNSRRSNRFWHQNLIIAPTRITRGYPECHVLLEVYVKSRAFSSYRNLIDPVVIVTVKARCHSFRDS